jgi:SAM-dependent methyltransferase
MSNNIWSNGEFARRFAETSGSEINLFETENNELSVLSLIPHSTETVLDYGTSNGSFANRASQQYETAAYDIAESAREVSRQSFPNLTVLDEVEGKFDCIVLKLVLHLVENPAELLGSLTENLTEKGCFVVSLPHPIDVIENRLKVRYDSASEMQYEITEGNMDLPDSVSMYWRPQSYWIDLFGKLDDGYVMTAIDEPVKDGILPKRLNMRFEKEDK